MYKFQTRTLQYIRYQIYKFQTRTVQYIRYQIYKFQTRTLEYITEVLLILIDSTFHKRALAVAMYWAMCIVEEVQWDSVLCLLNPSSQTKPKQKQVPRRHIKVKFAVLTYYWQVLIDIIIFEKKVTNTLTFLGAFLQYTSGNFSGITELPLNSNPGH